MKVTTGVKKRKAAVDGCDLSEKFFQTLLDNARDRKAARVIEDTRGTVLL